MISYLLIKSLNKTLRLHTQHSLHGGDEHCARPCNHFPRVIKRQVRLQKNFYIISRWWRSRYLRFNKKILLTSDEKQIRAQNQSTFFGMILNLLWPSPVRLLSSCVALCSPSAADRQWCEKFVQSLAHRILAVWQRSGYVKITFR